MALENLNEIVHEVLSLLHSELLIRKVKTITDLTPQLLPVIGDRVRLQQVLLNLVVNACDAMADVPQAERQITIRTEQAEDGLVQVSVSDRGSGFPASDSDEMFQAFRTTKQNGLGLGLIVCRSIIDSHGGRLSVNNNVERGATVRFSLKTHSAGPKVHAKTGL
jgi:C4-dicarboxylate-specific signal transduction histidine kinase